MNATTETICKVCGHKRGDHFAGALHCPSSLKSDGVPLETSFVPVRTPFPITNNSAHNFTSAEVAKLREYVSARTLDRILRAEISATEITISTDYGFHTFNLIDVFPPLQQDDVSRVCDNIAQTLRENH